MFINNKKKGSDTKRCVFGMEYVYLIWRESGKRVYSKYIKWETEVEPKVRRIQNLIRRHNLKR